MLDLLIEFSIVLVQFESKSLQFINGRSQLISCYTFCAHHLWLRIKIVNFNFHSLFDFKVGLQDLIFTFEFKLWFSDLIFKIGDKTRSSKVNFPSWAQNWDTPIVIYIGIPTFPNFATIGFSHLIPNSIVFHLLFMPIRTWSLSILVDWEVNWEALTDSEKLFWE